MLPDNELAVLTRRAGASYKLIPVGRLAGDFPVPLVAGCSHWLMLDGDDEETAEFRPLNQAWQVRGNAGRGAQMALWRHCSECFPRALL